MIIWSKKKKKFPRNNQTINFPKLKIKSYKFSKINFCLPHISNEQTQIAIFFSCYLYISIHFRPHLLSIFESRFVHFRASEYIRHKIPQLNRTMDKPEIHRVPRSFIGHSDLFPVSAQGFSWAALIRCNHLAVSTSAFRCEIRMQRGIKPELVRISRDSRPFIPNERLQCAPRVKFIHCPRIRLIFLYTARFMLFDFFIHLSREYLSTARDNRVTNGIKLLRSLDFSNDALQL